MEDEPYENIQKSKQNFIFRSCFFYGIFGISNPDAEYQYHRANGT